MAEEQCTPAKTQCIQKGGTRYFEGVPVTLPCWQYQTTRRCTNGQEDTCQPLEKAGCEEVLSHCSEKVGNSCRVQEKTYRCPLNKCRKEAGIVCGGSFFCMNGHCTTHNPALNQDFDRAVAGLGAIGAAGSDIKKTHGVQAFAGANQSCRKLGYFGFNNCCADHGWGQSVGLSHCNDEEKHLGQAKQDHRVYHIGFRCDHHYPWPLHGCAKGHEVYCVFPTRLATLVQLQGRQGQLHIDFGNADSPNCRGLTPTELSHLDFSKIDLSSLYGDFRKHDTFPNADQADTHIVDHIQDEYRREDHDDQ